MALHLSYYLPYTRQAPTYNINALQRSYYNNARITHQVKCSVNTQFSQSTDQRRSANYQPSIWSYNYLQSLQTHHADDEKYKNRAKKLEQEVRCMINNEDAEMLSILELIDEIQRLGLGYRFEEEIKSAFDRIVSWEGLDHVKAEEKLHVASLRFRLLRQNGYQASQDVFKIFMDHEGKFMAHLQNDVKGMLSLYEASHLAFEGENILEEAFLFSQKHLSEVKRKTVDDPVISELVSHSLELPLHRRMRRLEARWYIESQNKTKDANRLLLELAKLDFNMVQSILQSDLKIVTRWWTGIELANKLEFARDRLMESFFWSVGMAPDARLSNCRQGLTKVAALITTIDDVYDVYGTLDELELFTEAVKRWDLNFVNELPLYMKLCFMALYNTVNEMAYDSLKEHGENVIPYLVKAWADMCKAFLQEAKWLYTEYTPTFDDYLENAWRSSSGPLLLVHSYFLVNQSITKEALESLENLHNLLRWPSTIFRLCNDLVTSTAEIQRGETANAILCYMRDTGVSEELARAHLRNLIDENWKNMNKDLVDHDEHPFAEPFVEIAINLARIAHCTYQYGDGHGSPDARAKKRVLSSIIEPVSVMERQEHYHT